MRRLYYDVDSRTFLSGYHNPRPVTLAASLGRLSGEKTAVALYFLKADGAGKFTGVDLETHAVTLKIQRFNRPPQRGTFTVTYSGETTVEIDVNASLYDIECAINALSTVIAAGGVEVIPMSHSGGRVTQRSDEGGYYGTGYCRSVLTQAGGKAFIAWKTLGAKADFTLSTEGVLPLVYPFTPVVVTGDAYTREVVALHMHEQRLADIQAGVWSPVQECSVRVTNAQTGDGVKHAIQRVKIDPEPAGGVFALEIGGESTGDLSVFISALWLRDALRKAAGTDQLIVRKPGIFEWEVEWLTYGAKDLLIADDAALECNRGISGEMTWNVPLLHMLAMSGPDGLEADVELTITELATGRELTPKREHITIHQSLT